MKRIDELTQEERQALAQATNGLLEASRKYREMHRDLLGLDIHGVEVCDERIVLIYEASDHSHISIPD
jgi:hypothetical protein